MANPEHLARLAQITVWNDWRRRSVDDPEDIDFEPDLSGADLGGADLIGANLSLADLGGANLRGARLNRADFTGAFLEDADVSGAELDRAFVVVANLDGARLNDARLVDANLSNSSLVGASLRGADLTMADLMEADLSGADLSGACLRGTRLSQANLGEADLSGAEAGWTSFGNIDLSVVKGLETVKHAGPSTIGIDTIYRSGGNIPEGFLRGCGVPEQFITYARSLVGQAIEFYSCFISYASRDESFAAGLHAGLRDKGLRCWFAPEDLKIGDRFQERIEESIRLYDKVMIVLSEASVQSRWVEREVNAAHEREDREDRIVLFPIRIDDAVMNAPQPWAADIRRSRHIGDFSRWKDHDAYSRSFERLLRDLQGSS